MSKNETSAKIILDSISPDGKRITTFQLRFPRMVLAEFNTHRVISKNASSSRAIPVMKNAQMIMENPFIPEFTKNQKGMMANEKFDNETQKRAEIIWEEMLKFNYEKCLELANLGVSKQYANRPLECFSYVSDVATATDFDNFFELRIHEAAQPEIRLLASMMKQELQKSIPTSRIVHLPYVSDEELMKHSIVDCVKISVARCARVSYLNHEGKKSTLQEDKGLYDRLVKSRPIHASPSEHQAVSGNPSKRYKNFDGWVQYRYCVEKSVGMISGKDVEAIKRWEDILLDEPAKLKNS